MPMCGLAITEVHALTIFCLKICLKGVSARTRAVASAPRACRRAVFVFQLAFFVSFVSKLFVLTVMPLPPPSP
jgi:hypothetical protein